VARLWHKARRSAALWLANCFAVYPRNLAPLHYQIASEMQLAATINMQRVALIILRCVIPVVLSNNKNKLLVHMYIVKNTTDYIHM
jgi:hypothetical protein